jgi:RHS repeat-associated protein
MFAGTFYDTAPTTYDADARRLNPNQGCWISRDPAGLAAVDPTNPQSWNRYVYVANNPLSFVDPSGLNKQPCPAGAVYGCDWFSLAVLLDPALWFPYLMDTGCYSEGCTYLWGFALFTGGGSCYYALQNPCGGRGNSSREGGGARVSGWLTNRLGACTQTFFGIETRTFVPAVRGVNGTFFGLDSNRNGVSVETNATKFSSTQLAFTAPWTLFGEGVKESLTQTTQASTT